MFHLGFLQTHEVVPVSLKRFKKENMKNIKPVKLPYYLFFFSSQKLTFQLGSNSVYTKKVKVFITKLFIFSRDTGGHIRSSLS